MLSKQCVRLLLVSTTLLLLIACNRDIEDQMDRIPGLMEVPDGFPDIIFPEDNQFTYERWSLGKKLFFDPALSVDSSVSCASCHQPALAFTDGLRTSLGTEGRQGRRNSPSLANVAYHPYFTREGGVPTLEMQVLVPVQEHDEFNFNIVLLGQRLGRDSQYVAMARSAYDRNPDPFVITRALACFERSLISGNSPYDRYIRDRDPEVLGTDALKGMDLFFSSRTECSTCHGGFNFTNYAFENNGLYESYKDPGRNRLTGNVADLALFKVPSLRNVGVTGPYMHDGSFQTLEEVIAHYSEGGKEHPNKNPLVRPLLLSAEEQKQLVAFLRSLTDESFIENPIFR